MKRLLFISLLLLGWMSMEASINLSDSARFTWITCQPSSEEVYTLFGHTALRVIDNANNIDCVFNYGVFSFEQPHFIPKFVRGETDYQLGISNTQQFLRGYYNRGSIVYEQTLNLAQEEKARLWHALCVNYRPENREYRYNFIFDNCVTRPMAMLGMSTDGEVELGGQLLRTTYRQLVTEYVGYDNWTMFGIDLVFGKDADAPIGDKHEEMFLPMYARERLQNAVVVTNDTIRPLVTSAHRYEARPQHTTSASWQLTPTIFFIALLVIVVLLSILEWYKKSYFAWLDATIFALVGILGIIVFFLMFISVHPLVQANWNISWAHPLQFVFAVLVCIPSLRHYMVYYQYANAALILLTLVVATAGMQVIHAALWPLLALLLVRVVLYILKFGKRQR